MSAPKSHPAIEGEGFRSILRAALRGDGRNTDGAVLALKPSPVGDLSNIGFDSHPATEDMSNIDFDSHPATEGEGGLKGRKRSPLCWARVPLMSHVRVCFPVRWTLNRRVARQGRTLGISLNRRVARQGRTLGISLSSRVARQGRTLDKSSPGAARPSLSPFPFCPAARAGAVRPAAALPGTAATTPKRNKPQGDAAGKQPSQKMTAFLKTGRTGEDFFPLSEEVL